MEEDMILVRTAPDDVFEDPVEDIMALLGRYALEKRAQAKVQKEYKNALIVTGKQILLQ